jgi:sulfite exporter TauE/SafE
MASSLPAHVVYNSGRVFSYALIGGLAGFLGGVLGSVQVLGTWFSIVGGGVMVIAGALMLDLIPRFNVWTGGEHTWLRRLHLHSITNLLSLRSLESKFYIGLLTPFLPCGLLYSMFITAVASGNIIEGALTMLIFGAGIVPALLLTGMVTAYIGIKLRFYANKLAGATIILMGVVMVMRGAGVPLPFMGAMHEGHHHVAPVQEQTHEHHH